MSTIGTVFQIALVSQDRKNCPRQSRTAANAASATSALNLRAKSGHCTHNNSVISCFWQKNVCTNVWLYADHSTSPASHTIIPRHLLLYQSQQARYLICVANWLDSFELQGITAPHTAPLDSSTKLPKLHQAASLTITLTSLGRCKDIKRHRTIYWPNNYYYILETPCRIKKPIQDGLVKIIRDFIGRSLTTWWPSGYQLLRNIVNRVGHGVLSLGYTVDASEWQVIPGSQAGRGPSDSSGCNYCWRGQSRWWTPWQRAL